jgi:hypothetical protein
LLGWAAAWLVAAAAAQQPEGALEFASGERRCHVRAREFVVTAEADAAPLVSLRDPSGRTLAEVASLWLTAGGRTYHNNPEAPLDLHVNRAGVYLTEFHLENILLTDGASRYPRLAELSVYCHRDKVHVALDLVRPEAGWVRRADALTGRTRYVYEARAGKAVDEAAAPSALGFDLRVTNQGSLDSSNALLTGNMAIRAAGPDSARLRKTGEGVAVVADGEPAEGASETPGVCAALLVGGSRRDLAARLELERDPLPAGRLTLAKGGEAFGYDPRDGLWKLIGVSSDTPNPAPGQRGGAEIIVRNDGRARTILIEQRDDWGGIAGGALLDARGAPLPTPIQFELNFPERSAHGERGFASLLYPLELAPDEETRLSALHLFNCLEGRDLVYLNSLEPATVNHAAILQVSVGREESHTARLGSDFHLTDFRPHFRDRKGPSASASAIRFASYRDRSGAEQRFKGGAVRIIEAGPALIEYECEVVSTDGRLDGAVRIWQPASSDRTRIFSEVDLVAREPVPLDKRGGPPLFFTRYEVGNPMVYRKFAFVKPDGSLAGGVLPWSGPETRVVADGEPAAEPFFLCMFDAPNYAGTDAAGKDIPITERAGSPLMVVRDWDVTAGGTPLRPGVYAFAAGPDDALPAGAQYRRGVAAVSAQRLGALPPGSRIRYRAVHVTGGGAGADASLAQEELRAWGGPYEARAPRGTLLSDWPVHVQAEDGRAEVDITGGRNWLPIRVSGLTALEGLTATVWAGGDERPVGADSPGEPWYNAWPAEGGGYGVTFLIRLDEQTASRVVVEAP